MAYANYETREIHCKVLMIGAKGSGKTTNLRSVYRRSSQRLAQSSEQFIDDSFVPYEFIPLSLGQLKDFHVKMHLYTLPEPLLYPSFNQVLLKGVDGVLFVIDSSLGALQENLDSWLKAKDMFAAEGINLVGLPRLLQYNKRDHEEALPVDILRQEFNSTGLTEVEAIATQHQGTLESIQRLSSLILEEFGK